MKIIDKSFKILQEIYPNLSLGYFLEKLQPIFEQNKGLSKDQIKKKMLEYIEKEKPFGEAIAKGASYVLKEDPSYEDSVKAIESPEEVVGYSLKEMGIELESLEPVQEPEQTILERDVE